MASTKTKPTLLQQEQTRAAIKTTQLVKRLQGFALGERETHAKKGEDEPKLIEIDPTRLRAIEILLRKSLPDLSAITLSGDADNPVKIDDVGAGSAKLLAALEALAERSGTTRPTDAE